MLKALKATLITCLFLAYPFLSAYLARQGYSGFILVVFAGLTLWRGIKMKKTLWRAVAFALAISLLLGVYFANVYLVWLIPALVYLWLTFLFGYTLRFPPSICERLVRLQFPEFKPGIAEYLQQVTWVWAVFFAVNVPVCALLPILVGQDAWALYTGLWVYVLMFLLMLAEWFYRRKRFPDLEIPPMMETARCFALQGHKAFKDIWS